MDVPAAVLALVLFETAVGGLAVLWAAPTWGAVRHGYEILLSSTLGLMALGAWGAMRGPLASVHAVETAAAVDWTSRGLAATAVAALLSALLIAARAATAGRVVGVLATLAGLASFVPLSRLRLLTDVAAGSTLTGVAEIALGALFLGAVWDGMILGHWYLVERRLSNRYMVWIAWVNIAAIGAGLGSLLLSSTNPVPDSNLYSPLLAIGSFTVVMGAGLLGLVALIAVFNVKLAREGGRSIQASTGMFYLAVILAPAAEFAAKIRFY